MILKNAFVIVLLLTPCCFTQVAFTQDTQLDPPSTPVAQQEPIMGYWQHVERPDYYVGVEPKRFLRVNEGNELLVLPVADLAGDSISIPSLGQATPGAITFKYTIKDGTLNIQKHYLLKDKPDGKKIELRFKKVAQKPASLEINSLVVAEAEKLDKKTVKEIRESLRERTRRDQESRLKPFDKAALQAQTDDFRWLKSTIKKYGWIDVERFGTRATQDAFLMAQHCLDLRLKLAAEEGMKRDLDNGQPVDGIYAWIADRNSLYLQGRQKFGTHFRANPSGGIENLPLLDDAK